MNRDYEDQLKLDQKLLTLEITELVFIDLYNICTFNLYLQPGIKYSLQFQQIKNLVQNTVSGYNLASSSTNVGLGAYGGNSNNYMQQLSYSSTAISKTLSSLCRKLHIPALTILVVITSGLTVQQ